MKRRRRLAALMSASVIALACCVAAGAIADPNFAAARSAIVLRKPLPNLVRIAQRVTVSGHVRNAPRGAHIALESKRTGRWRVVTRTRLGGSGAFSLRWLVQKSTALGPVKLRLVLTSRGQPLFSTAPVQTSIGSAPVYCHAPVPPAVNIPSGDGWIVGGVYSQGGPFPGFYECAGSTYTVTATNPSGAVVASETVPPLGSYTLVLPAGRYALASDACRGSASVVAGRETKANTYCDDP